MSTKPLIVLGTGGHASVVIDLAKASGFEVKGCAGPCKPEFEQSFCPYLGDDSHLDQFGTEDVDIAVGIGSVGAPGVRKDIFIASHSRGFRLPALVHPRATVAASARLGAGSQVMAGAVVNSHADIGRNVIINSAAVIEHHVVIGDHVHIAPGAVVCGGARIGSGCHIGANATVLQGLTVGEESIVAAGSCVVRDVAAGQSVKGPPAV